MQPRAGVAWTLCRRLAAQRSEGGVDSIAPCGSAVASRLESLHRPPNPADIHIEEMSREPPDSTALVEPMVIAESATSDVMFDVSDDPPSKPGGPRSSRALRPFDGLTVAPSNAAGRRRRAVPGVADGTREG